MDGHDKLTAQVCGSPPTVRVDATPMRLLATIAGRPGHAASTGRHRFTIGAGRQAGELLNELQKNSQPAFPRSGSRRRRLALRRALERTSGAAAESVNALLHDLEVRPRRRRGTALFPSAPPKMNALDERKF